MEGFQDAIRGSSNEAEWVEFARRLDSSQVATLSRLVRGLRTEKKPAAAASPKQESPQPAWAGDEFAVVDDTNCTAPRAKVSLRIREDGICLRGKSGQELVVPRSLVEHRVHVTINDRFKKDPLALFVLVLREPVRWGRTTVRAVAMQAPTKRRNGVGPDAPTIFVPQQRTVDSSKLAAALPAAEELPPAAANQPPRSGWRDAPGCLLAHFLTAVFGPFSTEDRSEFVSSESETSIKCFLNVQEGLLWPLREGLLFGPKAPFFLPRNAIAAAHVSRAQQTARTFDLDIERVPSSIPAGGKKSLQFSMLETPELDRVRSYLEQRRFGEELDTNGDTDGKRAESAGPAAAGAAGAGGGGAVADMNGHVDEDDEDEEDDRDFNTDDESETSDDDDEDEGNGDNDNDEEDLGDEDSETGEEEEDDDDDDDDDDDSLGSEAPVTIVPGKAEAEAETDDESSESGAVERRNRSWSEAGEADEPASKRQRQ